MSSRPPTMAIKHSISSNSALLITSFACAHKNQIRDFFNTHRRTREESGPERPERDYGTCTGFTTSYLNTMLCDSYFRPLESGVLGAKSARPEAVLRLRLCDV